MSESCEIPIATPAVRMNEMRSRDRDSTIFEWNLYLTGWFYTPRGIVSVVVKRAVMKAGFHAKFEYCCDRRHYEQEREAKKKPTREQLRTWADELVAKAHSDGDSPGAGDGGQDG